MSDDHPYSRKPRRERPGGGAKAGAGGQRPYRSKRHDDRKPVQRKRHDDSRSQHERLIRRPQQEPAGSPDYSALAYRWREGRLRPIAHPQFVVIDDLLGIDQQKAALLENTRQFIHEHPANHALLTGARGTGKSSLVKAMLNTFSGEGLRLVEVPPHDLLALPEILAPLRGQAERYILYVDDFSVQANDPALTALKTALDGGIEAPADNVLIYATSNRRHLMPEYRKDNEEYHWVDDELHPGESTEEKISLSERFGLWLSFPPFNQKRYLELVQLHLSRLGFTQWDEALQKEALRWALSRASRSGRVAQQFARSWAGQAGLQKQSGGNPSGD